MESDHRVRDTCIYALAAFVGLVCWGIVLVIVARDAWHEHYRSSVILGLMLAGRLHLFMANDARERLG